MGLKVLDPFTREELTAVEFIKRHGVGYQEKGYEAVCSSCHDPLILAAAPSLKVDTHFRHHKDSQCFYKNMDRVSQMIEPSGWDRERGERLFRNFCEEDNLKQAYYVCFKVFPGLRGDQFYILCQKAIEKRLWCFVGIDLPVLPYLMATLMDVPRVEANYDSKEPEKPPKYIARAILHRPPGKNVDYTKLSDNKCYLIVHIVKDKRGQGAMQHSPIRIPDDRYLAKPENIEWMSSRLVDKLRRCCDEHGLH